LATPQHYRSSTTTKSRDFARRAHRASIAVAPNRLTRKRAPTSFEFDRLNGALLSVLIFKNPDYRRAAAAEHSRARS